MEEINIGKIDLIHKKLSTLESQLVKIETILNNLDYIKNSMEKVKSNNDINELCSCMKKLSLVKPA